MSEPVLTHAEARAAFAGIIDPELAGIRHRFLWRQHAAIVERDRALQAAADRRRAWWQQVEAKRAADAAIQRARARA